MTFDVYDCKTLSCFSIYTENTESTKPNYELELLKMVRKKNANLVVTMPKSMVM